MPTKLNYEILNIKSTKSTTIVLHKLYYLQLDISAILVEAVFKLFTQCGQNGFNYCGWNIALWII